MPSVQRETDSQEVPGGDGVTLDRAGYDRLSRQVNDLLAAEWVRTPGNLPTGILALLWEVDMDRVRLRELLEKELRKSAR